MKWTNIGDRINLAGVQYSDYQLVCKPKCGKILKLIGEPSNEHDRMAIRVEYDGVKIGYIPRGTVHQSEVWNAYRRGARVIAVLTAFNKTNPTWCMITVQLRKTVVKSDSLVSDEVQF